MNACVMISCTVILKPQALAKSNTDWTVISLFLHAHQFVEQIWGFKGTVQFSSLVLLVVFLRTDLHVSSENWKMLPLCGHAIASLKCALMAESIQ